jgi:hypothetical protein
MFGKQITLKTLSMLSIAIIFSGCSGGSGVHESSLPPVSGVQPSTKVSTASRSSITIAIPIATTAAQSTSRALKYISSFTKSVSISTNGQTPVNTNVGATLPGCQSISGQKIACTIGFNAPLGADTLGVKLYDGSGASGNVLSSAQVAVNIDGSPQNIPITLTGVPSTITLSTPPFTIPPCAPTGSATETEPLTVNAYDIDGSLIVGSAAYLSPINIAVSDTSGNTTLSKTAVTSPADSVNVTHVANFGSMTPITITATSSGTSNGITASSNAAPLTLKIPISVSAQQTITGVMSETDTSVSTPASSYDYANQYGPNTFTLSQVVTVTPSIGYGSDGAGQVTGGSTSFCKVSTNLGVIGTDIFSEAQFTYMGPVDEFISASTLGNITSWNLYNTAVYSAPISSGNFENEFVLTTPVELYSTPLANTSWSVNLAHISSYQEPPNNLPSAYISSNTTANEVASTTIPSNCSLSSGVTASSGSVTISDKYQADPNFPVPLPADDSLTSSDNDSIVSYLDPFIGNFCSTETFNSAWTEKGPYSHAPWEVTTKWWTNTRTDRNSLTATITAPPVMVYADGTSGPYKHSATETGSSVLIPPTITSVESDPSSGFGY